MNPDVIAGLVFIASAVTIPIIDTVIRKHRARQIR